MNAPLLANCRKRVRPGRRLSLRQVLDFQEITHEAAQGLRADFQGATDREERARAASAISNLAKGWVSLQDAKREILGRPKAGSLRPKTAVKPQRVKLVVPTLDRATALAADTPSAGPRV